jgi:protein-S-isoprenylcysteine O-methyltransferase Ste14
MATLDLAVQKLDLPLVLVLFSLIVLVLPMARQRALHGTLGFALHRGAHPLEPVVGTASLVLALGITAGTAIHAAYGPAAAGVWPSPRWLHIVALVLAGAGTLVTAVAQSQMGSSWRIGIDHGTTSLVTGGLYRFVRNPIFAGCIVAVAGMGLLAPSAWSIAASFSIVLLIALQVRIEEEHLLRVHGGAYRAYATRVGRFLPGVGRLPG